MFKKRLYTFILASNPEGKVWRLSLPYSLLVALGVSALIGIFILGGAAFQYAKMLHRMFDYDDRLSENDALRFENQEYRVQTAKLGEKIDILENLSHKLEVFSGMNSEKTVGGVGGVSKDTLTQARPASGVSLQTIAAFDKKIDSLEERFRDLNNQITDEVLVEAAIPKIQPVRGYITAGWGRREDPFQPGVRESHPGVDISAPMGTGIIAPADGTVIYAGQRAGYGKIIIIDHKFGITTRYGHLQRMNVQVGQHISRYDIIGYVGMSGRSTGPHLHYEVWHNGRCLDPAKYFQTSANGHGKP